MALMVQFGIAGAKYLAVSFLIDILDSLSWL